MPGHGRRHHVVVGAVWGEKFDELVGIQPRPGSNEIADDALVVSHVFCLSRYGPGR